MVDKVREQLEVLRAILVLLLGLLAEFGHVDALDKALVEEGGGQIGLELRRLKLIRF